ncbi:MAG: DNA polymerase III subunit beta [Defluviitaleaceae bacterium]|nr:DNA polymerase III subunit beta [Defluviitaleaceae bacterium]
MIFTCDRNKLQDALTLVGRAVSTRTTSPILECILLTATDDGLTLIGNDKEICIQTTTIEAQVEQQGAIALDAKLFTDIIRKTSGNSIMIEVDDKYNAICKSGRSRLKMSGQPAEEFPVVSENELESADRYNIKSNLLKDMIKQTIFSVSLDSTKPIITGEKMEIKNNILEIVAIDMFRISYCSTFLGEDTPDSSAVVPGRALNELSRILPDSEEEITFYFTKSKAVFETKEFRLVSGILTGDFIRYDQIYNEDYSTIVVTDRVQLLNAFERAILVASENRMLPVKIEVNDDDLIITAQSDRGQVEDGVPCETEGKDLIIYFNPKYFIDVLRAVEEERVIVKFNTTLSPCTVRGMDSERGFRYLIVPLRPPA